MIASILLILLLLTTLVVVPGWLIAQPEYEAAPLISIVLIAYLSLAYVINRIGSFSISGLLLVALLPLTLVLIIFTSNPSSSERVVTLNFMSVAVLISSLVLSYRGTLIMIVTTFVITLLLLLITNAPITDFYAILVFNGIMAALIVTASGIQQGYARRLRDNEEQFRSLFEQASDAVFLIDTVSAQISANQRASELLGYSAPEITNLTMADLVVASELEESLSIRGRLLAKERIPPYERTLRRKDGSLVSVELAVCLVYDNQGKPLQFQTIARDISERKRSELLTQAFLQDMKALQLMNLELTQIDDLPTLYRRMVELTHERLNIDRLGLFLIDDERNELIGTYGIAPDGSVREENYYREPITADHWTHDIFNNPEHARFWVDVPVYDNGMEVGRGSKAASALWDGHKPIGYLVTDNFRQHQPPRAYQAELVSILGGTFGHLIRLKQTAARLRDNEERLNLIVAAAELGTWDWDLRAKKLTLNDQWTKIFGYTEQDLPGDGAFINRLIHPDDYERVLQDFNMHLRGDTQMFATEHRVRVKSGAWRWVLNTGRVILRDKQGNPLRISGIHLDVTERKELEQKRIELNLEQERIKILSRFVQNASHEFRTPLATIQTGLYLLNKFTDPVQRQQKTAQIEDQIKRITRLVDRLLIMSRLDSGTELNVNRVNVNQVLEEVTRAHQLSIESSGVGVEVEVPDLPVYAYVDLHLLQQAVGHILENAIRYTGEGGKVHAAVYHQDECAVIEITDTGMGIAPEVQPHIFERFYRQDHAHSTPGFGLGLPIAQRIMELHDGTILVESTPGKGSSFKLVLPINAGDV